MADHSLPNIHREHNPVTGKCVASVSWKYEAFATATRDLVSVRFQFLIFPQFGCSFISLP